MTMGTMRHRASRRCLAAVTMAGLLACASPPPPVTSPPAEKAAPSASATAAPAPEAPRGRLAIRIEAVPFTGSSCPTVEAGPDATVDIFETGATEPVATAVSGDEVELPAGRYRLRAHYPRDRGTTGEQRDLDLGPDDDERVTFRYAVRCTSEAATPPAEAEGPPPECQEANDCMIDEDGRVRPVRNAAERAARARFRPCEDGEEVAICRRGRCEPVAFGC